MIYAYRVKILSYYENGNARTVAYNTFPEAYEAAVGYQAQGYATEIL